MTTEHHIGGASGMFLPKTSLWKAFGPSLSTGRLWKTRPSSASETPAQLSICGKLSPNASFSRSHSATLSYNESGWETGGTICAVARSAATWPACCRNFANAIRQTPYATRTPKASDASAAQINISIFTASCIFRMLPRVSEGPSPVEIKMRSRADSILFPSYSFVTELRHVDPLFCCRIRYESVDLPEF